MKPPVIIDIETDGDPWSGRLLCIGFQEWDSEHAVVLERPNQLVLEYLADPERPIVEWSKYDARWLIQHGIPVNGPIYDGMVMAHTLNENTPLGLEWCAKRYLQHAMDKRIRTSAGNPVFKCDDGKEVPLGEAPLSQVMEYNQRDVETTARLVKKLWQRLEDSMWMDWYMEYAVPLTRVLLDMECQGMGVNLEESAEFQAELEVEAATLRERLVASADMPESFNPGSGPQLSAFLFRKVFELTDTLDLDPVAIECLKSCLAGEHEDCDIEMVSPVVTSQLGVTSTTGWHVADLLPDGFYIDRVGRTKVHGRWSLKGLGLPAGALTPSGDRPSSSSPALLTNVKAAMDPWVQDLLRWRKMTKVLSTYLRKFQEVAHNGRVYGRFNQTGTVTGRLSSSEPNLQNIPAHGELGPRVRNLFVGDLVVGDYSQLEPRLMAHFSQDPVLLDVYTSGYDIYLRTAEGIWGERIDEHDVRRGIAKTYVLAMGYGAGVRKLQQILTINGYPLPLSDVEWQYKRLQDLYSRFFDWREETIRLAKRQGYVETLSGRHRRLAAQFKSATWKARGYGERQAVNAVIQGSAGDVVAAVMVQLSDVEGLRLLAQVHDELVWERTGSQVPDLEMLRSTAETMHGYDLTVPLKFEPHVGRTWYEAKEGEALLLPEDFAGPFEDELQEVEDVEE